VVAHLKFCISEKICVHKKPENACFEKKSRQVVAIAPLQGRKLKKMCEFFLSYFFKIECASACAREKVQFGGTLSQNTTFRALTLVLELIRFFLADISESAPKTCIPNIFDWGGPVVEICGVDYFWSAEDHMPFFPHRSPIPTLNI